MKKFMKLFLKPFLALSLIALSLGSISGCATTGTNSPPASVAVQTQIMSLNTVEAMGIALQTAPGIIDAMYNAGKISKDTYNSKIVPVYNQTLGSYMILENATKMVVTAGSDPTNVQNYTNALNVFLMDQDLLKNLLMSMGVDPTNIVVTPNK